MCVSSVRNERLFSRYYIPLLQAYKDKDMKRVKELEIEMRNKENEQ